MYKFLSSAHSKPGGRWCSDGSVWQTDITLTHTLHPCEREPCLLPLLIFVFTMSPSLTWLPYLWGSIAGILIRHRNYAMQTSREYKPSENSQEVHGVLDLAHSEVLPDMFGAADDVPVEQPPRPEMVHQVSSSLLNSICSLTMARLRWSTPLSEVATRWLNRGHVERWFDVVLSLNGAGINRKSSWRVGERRAEP